MYIPKIEIKNLWGNDLPWTLNEDINSFDWQKWFRKINNTTNA